MAPRFDGVATIARFNWPTLVGTVGAGAALVALAPAVAHRRLGAAIGLAGATAIGGVGLSMATSWYVYDHRRVYRLIGEAGSTAGSWAVVHVGLDDLTPDLRSVLGSEATAVIDISAGMPPVHAKKRLRQRLEATPGRPECLPLADSSLDAVYLAFAGHEVRESGQRAALFGELHRVVRSTGRVVVAEHVLDAANVAVFGPGALHFETVQTWRDCGAGAQLDLVAERRLTPFVRYLEFRRA